MPFKLIQKELWKFWHISLKDERFGSNLMVNCIGLQIVLFRNVKRSKCEFRLFRQTTAINEKNFNEQRVQTHLFPDYRPPYRYIRSLKWQTTECQLCPTCQQRPIFPCTTPNYIYTIRYIYLFCYVLCKYVCCKIYRAAYNARHVYRFVRRRRRMNKNNRRKRYGLSGNFAYYLFIFALGLWFILFCLSKVRFLPCRISHLRSQRPRNDYLNAIQ